MERKQNVLAKLMSTKCFYYMWERGEFKILEILSHMTIHLPTFICWLL